MTLTAADRSSASRTCKIVGSAAVAAGAVAFLSDGGTAYVAVAVDWISGLRGPDLVVVGVMAGMAILGLACAVFGDVALEVALGAILAATVLGGLGYAVCAAASGWSRLLGLSILESSPAIGTPIMGFGLLSAAAGLVALAYCLTPFDKSQSESDAEAAAASGEGAADGAVPDAAADAAVVDVDAGTAAAGALPPRRGDIRKFNVAFTVGLLLVILPGWVAAAAPAPGGRFGESEAEAEHRMMLLKEETKVRLETGTAPTGN